MSADVQVAGGWENEYWIKDKEQMNNRSFRLIGKICSANIVAI